MTKEQLLKENAILHENNKQLGEQTEELRKDMCRVLGSVSYSNDYGTRKEIVNMKTWAEIFAEIGKLKAQQKAVDTLDRVTSVEQRLGDHELYLERYFKEKKQPRP